VSKRKIAVFTGNRAEYGLQYPILKALQKNRDIECLLMVSGAHLDNNFGSTLTEIKNDGFDVACEVKIEMPADTAFSTPQAIGAGIISISNALRELAPDIFVVYADRFEGFAAVVAATQMNIPTAHIEGGDITEGGALDDSVRHAMTKLSHLHFTTNDEATNRIIAMGEEAWRVHTVGFPAIDLISNENYASADEIRKSVQIDTSRPVVLFTQHSVTTEVDDATGQVRASIAALKRVANEGIQVIITYPNNDAGGKAIISELDRLDAEQLKNIVVCRSLGRYIYHGILALGLDRDLRIVCAGNSSSGIKETPVFGCPTVNIGSRQSGRLRGSNVVDAGYDEEEIYAAIMGALFDDDKREACFNTENPYWKGGAGAKIAEILAGVSLDQKLIRKRMMILGNGKVSAISQ